MENACSKENEIIFFNFLKGKVMKLEKLRTILKLWSSVADSQLTGIDEVELEIFAKQVHDLPRAV